MKLLLPFAVITVFSIFFCGVSLKDVEPVSTSNNELSMPKNGKWQNLFDGTSLNGWHLFNHANEKVKNWVVEDGILFCLGKSGAITHGDLVTDKSFANFELEWVWKIDKGGNSGVMYHVVEDKKYTAPYQTGPEYQLIDDIGFPSKLEEDQKVGSDYAMTAASANKILKPIGEWNTSKIIFNKGQVEHWLNGKLVVKFKAWSDEWNHKRENGKWKNFPDYGKFKSGVIALQDHGDKVYFKKIRIKEL